MSSKAAPSKCLDRTGLEGIAQAVFFGRRYENAVTPSNSLPVATANANLKKTLKPTRPQQRGPRRARRPHAFRPPPRQTVAATKRRGLAKKQGGGQSDRGNTQAFWSSGRAWRSRGLRQLPGGGDVPPLFTGVTEAKKQKVPSPSYSPRYEYKLQKPHRDPERHEVGAGQRRLMPKIRKDGGCPQKPGDCLTVGSVPWLGAIHNRVADEPG